MNVYDDTPAGRLGKAAERLVRADYLRRGCYVLDAYAIREGGAPLFTAPDGRRLRVPDLLLAKAHIPRWVEVKCKRRPVLYQRTRQWRTGIGVPQWNDYLQIEGETGIAGWLAMLHLQRGPETGLDPILLEASFAELRRHAITNDTPFPGEPHGMVFWPTTVFDAHPLTLGIDGTALPNLTLIVHPWERTAGDGRAPGMPVKGEHAEQEPLF